MFDWFRSLDRDGRSVLLVVVATVALAVLGGMIFERPRLRRWMFAVGDAIATLLRP